MFAGSRLRFLALVHNPFMPKTALVLERLCAAATQLGLRALVVDAADSAPPPREMALLDLPSCIETLSPDLSYLAARGLPLRHVDAQGRCGGFLDAIERSAPQVDAVFVHAGTAELARLFAGRPTRPILQAGDSPRALTEAYVALKRLSQRPGWLAHDLLLVADPLGPRTQRLAQSLASCAERFLGAAIHDCVVIDPAAESGDLADPALVGLLRAQLRQDSPPEPEVTATTPRALAATTH